MYILQLCISTILLTFLGSCLLATREGNSLKKWTLNDWLTVLGFSICFPLGLPILICMAIRYIKRTK